MDLSPELVAMVHRSVQDPGPDPERQPLTDEDYDQLVTTLLATRPLDSPVWVFAYGSLLWKPGFACRGTARTTDRMAPRLLLQPDGARRVRIRTVSGTVTAFTFVSNRSSPSYVGKLPRDRVADVLATACGHLGSGAAYLYETVMRLRAIGIEDRRLWELQALVAERIRRSGSRSERRETVA